MRILARIMFLAVGCLWITHALAATLLEEHWNSGIDTTKWDLVSGSSAGTAWPGATETWASQGVGGTITLADQGGGDFAAKLDSGPSGSWYSPVGLYSKNSFPRGNNLRVTYRIWGGVGSPHGTMSPFHKVNPGGD